MSGSKQAALSLMVPCTGCLSGTKYTLNMKHVTQKPQRPLVLCNDNNYKLYSVITMKYTKVLVHYARVIGQRPVGYQ